MDTTNSTDLRYNYRQSKNYKARLNKDSINNSFKKFLNPATEQIQKEVSNHGFFSRMFSFHSTSNIDRSKRIHELLVELQTKEHQKPGTLFNLICQGDLSGIKDRLEYERKLSIRGNTQRDNILVNERDAAGGNIIHAAYLYKKYTIGRWLVENYPEIALEPYASSISPKYKVKLNSEDMPYAGENILHMTIVRKNIGEVRWLLDFYKSHKDSTQKGLERLLLGM